MTFALRGPVSNTVQVTVRLRAVTDLDRDQTGLAQGDVAQHQRRLLLAILALNKRAKLTERGGMVLAVDRHFQLGRDRYARRTRLEIETGPGEDGRAVDRIDGLGNALRSRQQDSESDDSEGSHHGASTGFEIAQASCRAIGRQETP